MIREKAVNEYVIPALKNTWNEKVCAEVINALEQEPCENDWRFYYDHGYAQAKRDLSCEDAVSRQAVDTLVDELARAISDERCYMSRGRSTEIIMQDILDLPPVTPQESTIKALGEELRKARKGIADEKVLIGYNLAVAICNKYLGESEET